MNITYFQDCFFGRQEVLSLLKKRLLGLKEGYRQNIALLGPRFVGKTTILQKFIRDFDDEDIIEIYVDLDHKDFRTFFLKYVGNVLYNYSKTKNLPLHDDVNLLIETTKEHIPQTTKVIKKIQTYTNQGKIMESYRALMTLPEIFTGETGKFCVIILDEFHNLDEMSIPDVFRELGRKIMTQKKSLYIMTSSLPDVASRILSEKLSLLFGDFEIEHIEAFDQKTCQEFLEYYLGDIRINPSLKNFLIDFTGGYPLYLNLITRELKRLSIVHRQSEIYEPLLIQALEHIIFDQWGVLSRHFELMINHLCMGKGNRPICCILVALAKGRQKLKDLVKDVGLKQSFISQKVSRLIEEGIVVKNGQTLYVADKLFKYWIKYIFQKRLKSMDFDSKKLQEEFVAELRASMNSFAVSSNKELSSRVVELLHCFDNEAFHLYGRKYKLPAFNDIISSRLKGGGNTYFDVIKASSAEGAWFIILKEDRLLEGDVNIFLQESKRLRQKPQRCIIISLSDLDENTKLRALQERMWIWNERELNTLLNIYDQHYIVT